VYTKASQIFIENALKHLQDQNLDTEFYMYKLTKDHFASDDSKTEE